MARVSFRPIADISWLGEALVVRCYYVLVHGRLDWPEDGSATDESDAFRPAGFYCHRYVSASDATTATETAFHRVKQNLKRLIDAPHLELEAEEVAIAPMHKLLKPDNRGHTFYDKE